VTNLILYQKTIKNKCEFYFSNVESLILENELKPPECREDRYLDEEHFPSLKMIMNLNNLKHLTISSKCKMNMLRLLLVILKQSSQLSSLTIIPDALRVLFTSDELCRYLNKMIKKLDIYQKCDNTLNEPDIITEFCEVFSNLEQLTCNIRKGNYLLSLLKKLPKLSFLNIIVKCYDSHFIDQFKKEVSNMNVLYEMYEDLYNDMSTVTISIWTG